MQHLVQRYALLVQTNSRASENSVFKPHPTPPQPHALCSINHVFECNERLSDPTPPQPHVLRTINHVFKCNECCYIPPQPHVTMCSSATNALCCKASILCSSATNVITCLPPQLHVLRSINHVIRSQPTPTPCVS